MSQSASPAGLSVAAIHEAGHAVVAAHLGLTIASVTIIGDPVTALTTIYRPPSIPQRPTMAEMEAIDRQGTQTWAGIFAERRYFGAGHDTGGGDDRGNLAQYARDYFPAEKQGIWKASMANKANAAVNKLWPAILDVAAQLDVHGTLTHSQLKAEMAKYGF